MGEKAFAAAIEDDLDGQVSTSRVRAKLLARRGEVEEALRVARDASSSPVAATTSRRQRSCGPIWPRCFGWRAGREEAAAAVDEAIRIHERKGDVAAAALLRRSVGERV